MEYERKWKTGQSTLVEKLYESMRVVVIISVGIMLGFYAGVSVPNTPEMKSSVISAVHHDCPTNENKISNDTTQYDRNSSNQTQVVIEPKAPSNPKGAERLPRDIVVSKSDFHLRRLWGLPSEDLVRKPKYLVTFTVGYDQRKNVDTAVKKFSENFTIVLFHYDGRTTEWDEFEWSKQAIHISAKRQTKWWYAKRFLHPDIVAAYDYIFVWDEDLGLEHFNAEEYIKLVKKHGLEISQPGVEPFKKMVWQMTRRLENGEVHKKTTEKPGFCSDPNLPPCAGFIEIMAPVFSRDAWRCVWYIIQNDLVHGWGLDFALQKCVEPAHEKIGVVDAQWIIHKGVPSLGNQGQGESGTAPWQGVRQRCEREWKMFEARMANAEKVSSLASGSHSPNIVHMTNVLLP